MLPKAGGLSTEGLFWVCSLAAQVSLQLFLLIPDALHMSEVILPCWDSFTLGIAVLGLNLAAPRQHFPNCFLLPSAPVPLCSSVLCFGTSPASLGQASKDLGLGWGDSMPSPAEGCCQAQQVIHMSPPCCQLLPPVITAASDFPTVQEHSLSILLFSLLSGFFHSAGLSNSILRKQGPYSLIFLDDFYFVPPSFCSTLCPSQESKSGQCFVCRIKADPTCLTMSAHSLSISHLPNAHHWKIIYTSL